MSASDKCVVPPDTIVVNVCRKSAGRRNVSEVKPYVVKVCEGCRTIRDCKRSGLCGYAAILPYGRYVISISSCSCVRTTVQSDTRSDCSTARRGVTCCLIPSNRRCAVTAGRKKHTIECAVRYAGDLNKLTCNNRSDCSNGSRHNSAGSGNRRN